ncbi:putative bifunctional diguanylate cyclase/phosphodiesterase [Geodermatophilus sabuli]|uniref:PAS domain S-box-containing protein n=1 Tax=Geodermatophilus sabuli TaxID=1564158 RepID=A0A285EI06_9ACTN|nr:GGDEF domain-containing phosphodiesterase [Geodermatophilus sabuli]MBB3086868.1 PAS domain S-box-containing protein [Geodermatophilus sabuli]SNX98758.1 PAS domain S-box-containing protein [Geodermatophilus sabuli]
MTSARVPLGPAAALAFRPLRGRTGLPAVAWIAVLSAAVSVVGAPAHVAGAADVVLGLTTATVLLTRAGRTVVPSGWRWFAAAAVVTGAASAGVPLITGVPASAVLGGGLGHLLTVVALLRLRERSPGGGRAQQVTAAALFVVASLLAVHVVLRPIAGVGSSAALAVAVHVVPVVVALSTAAALVFLGGVAPGRQRVGLLLVGVQSALAGTGVSSVLAWGLDSPELGAWVRPVMGLAAVLLCTACHLDVPRGPAGDPRLWPVGAVGALLPHATALVAGTLFLLQSSVTGAVDRFDLVLAITGLLLVLVHQVVTWRAQHRLTAELLSSQAYFRTLVRSSADPVVILDDRLRVTFASKAVTDLLGHAPDDVLGRCLDEVVHRDDTGHLTDALRGTAPGGVPAVRTARVRHADGSWRLLQATVRDLRDDPDVGAFVLYCRDVTGSGADAASEPALVELALTDPVTGLPNRAALVRRLAALRLEARGRPRALALLGVPGLAGRAPEDAAVALRALTARLVRLLRTEDWLARTKDGDFAVLAHGSIADAEVLAARLVATAGSDLAPSAGVTALPDDLDPGEALRHADLARRAAGPGQVHRYDDAVRQQRDRREALRADLAGALDRGELRLVFQPVVDLVLQRTVTVEALLRWRHPVYGEVSPAEFVPLAEESALITELGRWVLHEACTTVAALPGTELAVAVNVSARQLHGGSLGADVLAALDASGLPSRRLFLELTESMLLDDDAVIEELEALRQLGIRIAVDDFGTGWSSLAYLVGLPVDTLKMDRQFLAGVEHDQQRQALCRAVLHLGASLGLPVVVEGVEGDAEASLLRDMGHRYLQGFALSRPMEAAQLAAGGWPTGLPTAAVAPSPR